MRNNIKNYIDYIEKEYGIYIDLDIIEDPYTLPDYMTIKIIASTAKYGGGKEVNYEFETTTITESYLKKKIMEVVGILKGNNKQDFIVARGTAKSMYASLGSLSGTIAPSTIIDYRRQIKKVIFNDPATIIFWKDGSKTIVKCKPGDKYDKTVGFAMACCKYFFGNKGNYQKVFKKYVKEDW